MFYKNLLKMKTLDLENYGVNELTQTEENNYEGGVGPTIGLMGLMQWGVDEINQAWKEFIKGYETCKCNKENEK